MMRVIYFCSRQKKKIEVNHLCTKHLIYTKTTYFTKICKMWKCSLIVCVFSMHKYASYEIIIRKNKEVWHFIPGMIKIPPQNVVKYIIWDVSEMTLSMIHKFIIFREKKKDKNSWIHVNRWMLVEKKIVNILFLNLVASVVFEVHFSDVSGGLVTDGTDISIHRCA